MYYKVLLQYYYKVLVCTTKYQYYSVLQSTTLYYKVLLQYYSVLQSPTPVLLCTTKSSLLRLLQYYYVLQGTTAVLLCTKQYYSLLHRTTPAQVMLQRHQMLSLPRKIALMINPLDACNAIYNARSSTSHPPTSPNAAPATKNKSHDQSSWSMKRYLQCAQQHKSSSDVTKCCACH